MVAAADTAIKKELRTGLSLAATAWTAHRTRDEHAGQDGTIATRVWPAEPLDVKDGVLNYRGSRYALGDPGDSVVAGDWACTGEPSLALLRRDAGEIFAFDGWPDNENVITARPVGQVAGAVDLRVVDAEGDGCHELEVEREAAPPVRLRVRS